MKKANFVVHSVQGPVYSVQSTILNGPLNNLEWVTFIIIFMLAVRRSKALNGV